MLEIAQQWQDRKAKGVLLAFRIPVTKGTSTWRGLGSASTVFELHIRWRLHPRNAVPTERVQSLHVVRQNFHRSGCHIPSSNTGKSIGGCRTRGNHPLRGHRGRVAKTWASSRMTLWRTRNRTATVLNIYRRPLDLHVVCLQERPW